MLSEKVPTHRSTEKARSVAPPEAYKPSKLEVPSETINRTPIATNIRPERRLVVCKRRDPREISRPLSQRRRPRSRRSQRRDIKNRGAAVPAAYVARRPAPRRAEPDVAATVSTAPRMGPEQKPAKP